jgi:polysaccharide biosynthesis protein PslH
MRPVWANQGANGREHERTELAWLPVKTPNDAPHRWIIVADSPFIPARGGGEREHLGFVELAVEAGLVSALVVPTDDDPEAVGREDDLDALRALVFPAPLITVPRARSHLRALISPLPYVVASRPAPSDLVERVGVAAPDADAVVVFTYKSHEIGRVLAEGLNLPAVLRQHNLEGPYHHALAAAAKPPTS